MDKLRLVIVVRGLLDNVSNRVRGLIEDLGIAGWIKWFEVVDSFDY